MTDETRARIEEALRTWNDHDSEARKRFEAAQAKWDKELEHIVEAIERSERITEEDLAIIVY